MEKQMNYAKDNDEKKWKDIEIHGTEYIISTSKENDSWKISLSDLVEIWTETITKDVALARCQSLNMLLDIDTFDVRETLDIMLNDIPKYATVKSVNEIKLETCVEGITFKFNIKLTKGDCQYFWNEITKPLCQSSIELQRRHNIVINLIKKKDEELTEYKLSGAELTRKNIETLPYNKDMFGGKVVQSNSCINAFQSMMGLYHELKKCESLLDNDCRSLSQKPSSLNTGIKTKAQDKEVSETLDVNNEVEHQSAVKTETVTTDSSSIEPNIDGQLRSSNDNIKIDLQIKRNGRKRPVPIGVATVSLTSTEQSKPKKIKKTPNIYDFIP